MRKLASIQRIDDLQPIPDADRIVLASVLGWKVIVRKDEFEVGDYVVYVECDAVLPEKPEFEFLRNRRFRIKTMRMRKQLSQGICFPLSIGPHDHNGVIGGELGDDVTEILEIKKYDPAEVKTGSFISEGMKRAFPSYVPKTDETRIQASPRLLQELAGKRLYKTLKMDGTSATYCRLGDEVDVCSRNRSLKEPKEGDKESVYWKMLKKYKIDEILAENDGLAIQSEVIGIGIQKNRMGLEGNDLFVFNVRNIKEAKFLDYEDFRAFCKKYELRMVPLLDEDFSIPSIDIEIDSSETYEAFRQARTELIDSLLEQAKMFYENGHPAEGIVIRPVVETYSEALGGRLSVKVVNNDYLEKTGG